MTRTTMLGAAFAMLMSGAAFAQTNPAAPGEELPPAVDQIAPSAESPLMPANPPPEGEMPGAGMDGSMMGSGDMAEDNMTEAMRGDGGRRNWRARHGGPRGMHHGRRHWRDHHRGAYGSHGGEGDADEGRGAVLNFSQGGDGPSFRIRCADGDTTLECASAIAPILDRLIPQQPGAGQ